MKIKHPLLICEAPFLFGMAGIDIGDISIYFDVYLSLHCLPLRPRSPCSSCSLRAIWLHLVNPLLSYTLLSRISSSSDQGRLSPILFYPQSIITLQDRPGYMLSLQLIFIRKLNNLEPDLGYFIIIIMKFLFICMVIGLLDYYEEWRFV